VNSMKRLIPLIIVALLLSVLPVQAQQAYTPLLYFSEWNFADKISYLKVLDTNHQVHDAFETDNNGVFDSLSPGGTFLTFVRYDWEAPYSSTRQARLWLANLATGEQWAVTQWHDTAWGRWSSDGRYLLIQQLFAIAPMYLEEFNYGELSIYDVQTRQPTIINNLLADSLGWYSDNLSVLLYNEDQGFLRYYLQDGTIVPISFQPPVHQTHRRNLVFGHGSIAVNIDEANVLIYSLADGQLSETVPHDDLHGSAINRLWGSPDGRYLVADTEEDTLAIWDVAQNKLSAIFTTPSGWAPSRTSLEVAWGVGDDNQMFVFLEHLQHTAILSLNLTNGETSCIYQCAVSS
jgi:hypothetical protein